MDLIVDDIAIIRLGFFLSEGGDYQIEVEVGSSVMIKGKVSDHVRSLDIIWILIEGRQKPRILISYELSTRLIGP